MKRLFKKQSQKLRIIIFQAVIAQLGERQTEDLKVPGSIPGVGILFLLQPELTDSIDSLNSFSGPQSSVGRAVGC